MLKSLQVSLFAMLYMVTGVFPVMAGNNSGAAFTAWPDTGLAKCYDATLEMPCPAQGANFYGQDFQYAGPVRSYTMLGLVMVRDNVTGLIWEVKTDMDGIKDYTNPHDADNTYKWCDTNTDTNGGDEGTCGINDAKTFIDQLNSEGFGGRINWRLPTIKELATLINLGRVKPAIAPDFVTNTQSATEYSSNYWSATTKAGDPPHAWLVNFFYGHINADNMKSSSYYVRAVCDDGQGPPPGNRFVDNGSTVTDTVTGLEWQKATMDTTGNGIADALNWKDALTAAENLTLGGKSDWRLPDINELRSLVDYSHYLPAIDPIFAATTKSSNYWSSTSDMYYTGRAGDVNFSAGYDDVSGDEKTKHFYVRAVRGRQITVPPPPPSNMNSITPILLLLLKGPDPES